MKDYQRGRVYVAEAVAGEKVGKVKIGFTANPPEVRVGQLQFPSKLIHATDELANAAKIEKSAQRILALHGGHDWGEWFEATADQAIAAINLALRQNSGLELILEGKMRAGSGRGRPPVDKSRTRLLTFRIANDLFEDVDRYCRRIGGDRGPSLSTLLRLGLEADQMERARRKA